MEVDLQYLGSRPLTRMAAGLTVLQQPLKELYLPYKAPGHAFALEDCHLRVIPGKGVHLDFRSPYSPATRDQFCAVTSFTLWYALRYATIKTKDKRAPLKGGFAPLDESPAQQAAQSEGIYSTLDKEHKFLVKSQHPPMFVIVLRRTSGVHTLDLHAFICPKDIVARDLVEAVNRTHAQYSNSQASGAFGYSPFAGLSQVPPDGNSVQQLATAATQAPVQDYHHNKGASNALSVDSSKVISAGNYSQQHNRGDKHLEAFINAGRTGQDAKINPTRQTPIERGGSAAGVAPAQEVKNIHNLREANVAQKQNNSNRVYEPKSPGENKNKRPNPTGKVQTAREDSVPTFFFSPTESDSRPGKLGNGYSLLSAGNEPPSGKPSPSQPPRVYQGHMSPGAAGPPVHMGPYEPLPGSRPGNQAPGPAFEISPRHIHVGENQNTYALPYKPREIPVTRDQPGYQPHVLQSPPRAPLSPANPTPPSVVPQANQLLNELRAFHANNQSPRDAVIDRPPHYASSTNMDTASAVATEVRPVARVQGVRVLPSGGRPVRPRPKSEFYDRSPNWQLGSQTSLETKKAHNLDPGSPRMGDKLLQGRKKDAEIADALSHLKFNEAEVPTLTPGAPRGMNLEKSLGYFP